MENYPYNATGNKELYYSEIDNMYIFDYYTNKSLPLFGWFKPCMICCGLTSINFKFKYKNIYIQSFICKNCNQKYNQRRINLSINKLLKNSFITKKSNNIKDPSKILIKHLNAKQFCKNLLVQDI